MSKFISDDRSQSFLLPPDLRDWLPDDDLAHFVLAACAHPEVTGESFRFGGGLYHGLKLWATIRRRS